MAIMFSSCILEKNQEEGELDRKQKWPTFRPVATYILCRHFHLFPKYRSTYWNNVQIAHFAQTYIYTLSRGNLRTNNPGIRDEESQIRIRLAARIRRIN